MSDKGKLPRACWYMPPKSQKYRMGVLHAWSTDHEEYETGPGPVAVGVVEDEKTLAVTAVRVDRITFAANPDGPVEH